MLGAIPSPVPALKAAPDYFKKLKPQVDTNPSNGTVKRCVPFLDALGAGFILPLWADMYVVIKDGDMHFEFPSNYPEQSISEHSFDQIKGHPLSDTDYGEVPLKFMNPWVIETEEGVSCLFTSPLNHMETRWKILDGVVDTDSYYNNINFPFLWTGGDGEFFVPKGTPLVQVIPFVRQKFELEVSEIDMDRRDKTQTMLGTKMKNGYRDSYWHKRKDADAGSVTETT